MWWKELGIRKNSHFRNTGVNCTYNFPENNTEAFVTSN